MIIWNPWHGCHKISEGCQHCYMYFLDGKRGIDTSKVYRTENVSEASGEHKARESYASDLILPSDCSPKEQVELRSVCQRTYKFNPKFLYSYLAIHNNFADK